MKKRILMLTLLTALLLSGCAMRTVGEMYTPPKRSEEYKELQAAIDTAMYGLTYSSPQSGENQQTVQMADLDGDGVDEYLVFAKGASEKPLQVLIFQQDEEGNVRTMDTIGSNGLAFEQVEYVQFDDHPGCELSISLSVISAHFIQGRCSKGTTSEGISIYVSSSSENLPERFPFQK